VQVISFFTLNFLMLMLYPKKKHENAFSYR